MERWGLVAQFEAELERSISLGRLPKEGKLPSERTLASKYGVSRTTSREALVRLRARGLVQVHPGRCARAVLMEEAVRLENLGTALLGDGASHPERQQLLAGSRARASGGAGRTLREVVWLSYHFAQSAAGGRSSRAYSHSASLHFSRGTAGGVC